MTTSELLEKAKSRIEDKSNWAQFRLEDERGRVCALGAIYKCIEYHGTSIVESRYYLENAAYDLYGFISYEAMISPVARVNDELGHDAVLHMYDYAIKLAKIEEGDE